MPSHWLAANWHAAAPAWLDIWLEVLQNAINRAGDVLRVGDLLVHPWVYFLLPFLGEAFVAAFLAPLFGAAFLVALLETAFLVGAFLAAVFGAAFFAPFLTRAFLVGFAGLTVAFVSGGAAAGAGNGGGAAAGATTDGLVAGAGVSFTSESISGFSLSLRLYSNNVGLLLLRCRVFLMVPQSLCADPVFMWTEYPCRVL